MTSSTSKLKVLNIVGARPNFMKIAPIIREMRRHSSLEQILVHTGQHYDPKLSQVFFEELAIPPPDVNLNVGSAPRLEQIAKIQEAFEPVLLKEDPNLVLVVGDVNSTIACAEVAKRHGVKVAHVEAGLRSFDDTMPEEHNRIETDRLADYLFVTEASGSDNLRKESVSGKIFFVGNVMIDSLVSNLERAKASNVFSQMSLAPKGYALCTFHRPSNVDTRGDLVKLIERVSLIARRLPTVLPVHPRTRVNLEEHGLLESFERIEELIATEPLGYHDFLRLMIDAKVVVTDSGGIQEETTYLGVPCLTMRKNTERPVTLSEGTNVLIGNDFGRLQTELNNVLAGEAKIGRIPDLWDGRAAQRIVSCLMSEDF